MCNESSMSVLIIDYTGTFTEFRIQITYRFLMDSVSGVETVYWTQYTRSCEYSCVCVHLNQMSLGSNNHITCMISNRVTLYQRQ